MHDATAALLRYFEYDHLPPHLQVVSRDFHEMAHRLVERFEASGTPELTVALRKLLESKDAAVRCAL